MLSDLFRAVIMPPWNSSKAKVQLKISCQRLRTLQQKQEAQAKATRREIANLIERGKIETAKIKVENIINQDIHLELLEILELYCELLLARFGILDQPVREPDPAVVEGVNSVIYAAPRTELRELHILRDLLMHKYGREYSAGVMENRDTCVTDRVVRKLVVETPSAELVDAYLTEIAKAYNVKYVSEFSTSEAKSEDDEDTSDGGEKASKNQADSDEKKGDTAKGGKKPPPAKAPSPPKDEFEALHERFAALKKR